MHLIKIHHFKNHLEKESQRDGQDNSYLLILYHFLKFLKEEKNSKICINF